MNNKQTNKTMKHEKWTREEDLNLVNTINKHITPRVKWREIESKEFPYGRNLMSMKERFRRIESFLVFEREQFEIDLDKYQEYEEKMNARTLGRPLAKLNIDSKWQKDLNGLHYDFMTVQEFAEIFRVSTQTVRNMIKRKEIKAMHFGKRNAVRIPRTEIDKLIT
jgi:excisionase family DNA binding protein